MHIRNQMYNTPILSQKQSKQAKHLYMVVADYFGDIQEMLETLRISDVHYFRYFVRGNNLSDNTLHFLIAYIILEITKVIHCLDQKKLFFQMDTKLKQVGNCT